MVINNENYDYIKDTFAKLILSFYSVVYYKKFQVHYGVTVVHVFTIKHTVFSITIYSPFGLIIKSTISEPPSYVE